MNRDGAARRGRIAVVASCMMDMITTVPRLPELGETLRARTFQLGFGGKGANQAVMAARLGADVRIVARVGDDVFGRMTVENFQARGIAVRRLLVTPGASTGVAPILVQGDGANVVLIVPGANDLLTETDVLDSAEELRGADVMVGQLEVPPAATLAAFRQAKRDRAATAVLNPAPAGRLPDALLEATDVLVPNQVELAQLTGLPCDGLEDARHAARALLARGPGAVVVTLGARGALLVERDRAQHIEPLAVRPVDTTGAGDAFVGSLAATLASGDDLEAAVGVANAAAALSTKGPGTQTSFPDLDAVQAVRRQHPARVTPLP